MARIAGVDIPREKRVEVALTYIFGIGLPTSQKILAQANVNPDTRVRDLTEEQVNRLRDIIDRRYKVEGDLRREVALNIKRLQEIGSYRGLRHRRNLPARGQRTKTNARQRPRPKKTVGGRRQKKPGQRSGWNGSRATRLRAEGPARSAQATTRSEHHRYGGTKARGQDAPAR